MKRVILIIVLVIATLTVVGVTYSMYSGEASLKSDIALATFIVDAQKRDHIDISLSNINPGDNVIYNFSVSNSAESKKSDVTIVYNIIIKTMHFIPLDIELYKGDEKVLTCDETLKRNSSNELECQTEDIIMPYISDIKDDYKLRLSFPLEYSSYEYSSLVDYMNIEIKSSQKID